MICSRVAALAIPHAHSQAAGTVTVSIGLATTSPGGGGTASSLVAAADAALYQAKSGGRARAVLATYGE